MNKKISSTFAIIVIIIIAGFLTWIFCLGMKNQEKNDYSLVKKQTKTESQKCLKRVYDGEVDIKVWSSEIENGEIVVGVSKEDTEKFPESYRVEKAKLVDPSQSIAGKIKKATKEKPTEITIKGFYYSCEEYPLISIESGEKTFKKFLREG